jgi:uncharacterized protein DUF3465
MRKVTAEQSMSLDGYSAGPDDGVQASPRRGRHALRLPSRGVSRVGILLALLLGPACAPATPDNGAIERDYADRRSIVEVTAEGAVTSILSDEGGPSGTHQRFIIRLSGATQTVLVDNNVSIGQRVPVTKGDDVIVHGEYVWNDQGGLIHFTHHDPAPAHEGGWIELRGTRYQ